MPYGELPEINAADGTPLRGFPVVITNPPKTAVLRLPTAGEMLEYLGKQKIIQRNQGRGHSETEAIPNGAADLALFKKIRMDNGPEFDEFEAEYALDELTKMKVMPCQREGDGFLVELKTIFGMTVHHLGMPTRRDLAIYKRTVFKSRTLPGDQEEQRFPPEVPAALYDAIIQHFEGYADSMKVADIPPNHKRVVINAMNQALQDADPNFDPNF